MSIKAKILSGQKVHGTMIRLQRNPAIAMIAREAGLDFLMYDCEHGTYTIENLHDLFVTGNAMGFPSFVRVPQLSKDWVSRVLDAGATGVMVPMTETARQAAEIVKWSKYTPLGDRGYGSGLAHTNYTVGRHTEVMKAKNDEVIAIAQIESRLAVDNADAIAGTDGIDVLLIGPNDLSISLGIPGDLMNPIELEAIAHVAAACKKYGKSFGIHAGPQIHQLFHADETFMMFGTDFDLLSAGCRDIKRVLADIVNGEK
ncbi:MAG: aldolase/citrate lyase family protein [Bacillota bacterium]|nr:aldolase/citrate lyase family protein [Bacillota bacterium]